jgi:hypothetical protein
MRRNFKNIFTNGIIDDIGRLRVKAIQYFLNDVVAVEILDEVDDIWLEHSEEAAYKFISSQVAYEFLHHSRAMGVDAKTRKVGINLKSIIIKK